MKYITLTLMVLVISGFIFLGISSVIQHDNKIKMKEIQLKDSSVQLKELNEQYNEILKQKEVDSNKLKELENKKNELEKQLQAKIEKQNADKLALQQSSKKVTTFSSVASAGGDKYSLMRAAGIAESDFQAVDYIISKESGWRHLAVNRTSGATGLCQSLPASKMSSAGSDYLTNPVTQLKWCNGYAVNRYGGWWGAYSFWQANHWW